MKFRINSNQIAYDNGASSLIKMVDSDIRFWLSNKLIYPDRNGYSFTIYIGDGWTLNGVKKNQKVTVTADDVAYSFRNIQIYDKKYTPPIVHTPEHKAPLKGVTIDDDLIRWSK